MHNYYTLTRIFIQQINLLGLYYLIFDCDAKFTTVKNFKDFTTNDDDVSQILTLSTIKCDSLSIIFDLLRALISSAQKKNVALKTESHFFIPSSRQLNAAAALNPF